MLLKKNIILVSVFSIILFVSCSTEKKYTFSIEGKITHLGKNIIILSKIENLQKNTTSVIDTIVLNKNGVFKEFYNLPPNIYYLTFNTKTIRLAINKNQNIIIKGSDSKNLTINGSADTQLLQDYETFRKESLNRLVVSVRNKVKELKSKNASEEEIATLRQLEIKNYENHLDELTNFVKEKMGTSIAIYPTSLRWKGGKNLPFLESLVAKFEKKYPNLELTKKLKAKLILLKKTSVGGTISSIKMPNVDNKIIPLNNIKGKYVLIDFWASWCPPCRSESSLLNSLYNKYNSKGFEIYGISLDSKRESWIKAIKKDNRIWTEVSTVEGFKTPISIEYGVNALPFNFLLNSNGEIIAVNIHGEQLKEKITELFNY